MQSVGLDAWRLVLPRHLYAKARVQVVICFKSGLTFARTPPEPTAEPELCKGTRRSCRCTRYQPVTEVAKSQRFLGLAWH